MSTALRTKVLPWLLTLVLLTGAWALVKITLPIGSAQAPFPTTATIGEASHARNLTVTVTDVHAARHVADAQGWSADGTWLVVDLEASVEQTQVGALLGLATLSIGEREFVATQRAASLYRGGLVTGVPRSGSIAFELPADALVGTATLRLALSENTVLDGVIELPIDLDELPVEADAALHETGWAR